MNDRHESRIVLAVVRERWDLVDRLTHEAAPRSDVFLRVARECDVVPWIHALLEANRCPDRFGAEVATKLSEGRHKCRMDNLLLLARVEQALDLLLDAGIVPVALKGLDLMHRFDRGLDTRTLTDVDLLLRAKDVLPALAILEDAGWIMPPPRRRRHWLRSSHHIPFSSAGPVEVEFEIHWNLVQEKRYRLDPNELFERALPLEVAGRPVLRLEDHDFVAHLLLHHLSHYFDRQLKWVIDLEQVSRTSGFDWDTVVDRLEAWNGLRAASLAILHLEKLFPGIVPPEARHRFPVSLWRRLATSPLRSSHPLEFFSGTRRRSVQLYLAAVALENPWRLPGYLFQRRVRDFRKSASPAERASAADHDDDP